MVFEYLAKGSHDKFLMGKESQLSFGSLLDMALQICSGMIYLGEHNVIHRDLALRDILISQDTLR